jgi:hypothetical protein
MEGKDIYEMSDVHMCQGDCLGALLGRKWSVILGILPPGFGRGVQYSLYFLSSIGKRGRRGIEYGRWRMFRGCGGLHI